MFQEQFDVLSNVKRKQRKKSWKIEIKNFAKKDNVLMCFLFSPRKVLRCVENWKGSNMIRIVMWLIAEVSKFSLEIFYLIDSTFAGPFRYVPTFRFTESSSRRPGAVSIVRTFVWFHSSLKFNNVSLEKFVHSMKHILSSNHWIFRHKPRKTTANLIKRNFTIKILFNGLFKTSEKSFLLSKNIVNSLWSFGKF